MTPLSKSGAGGQTSQRSFCLCLEASTKGPRKDLALSICALISLLMAFLNWSLIGS
jgi:hypothetical protein